LGGCLRLLNMFQNHLPPPVSPPLKAAAIPITKPYILILKCREILPIIGSYCRFEPDGSGLRPAWNKLKKRRKTMPSQCELLQNCDFFRNFRGHSDAMKQGWVSMFCRNLEKSETSARKKCKTILHNCCSSSSSSG
jgi:hypothetical protein